MRIALAWEIGAGRGHAGPILALASKLVARGHQVDAFLRDPKVAEELPGLDHVSISPSPRWIGPVQQAETLNYGEILINFGFHSPDALAKLVAAWRERISAADLLVSNVAPAALVAALTLDTPALEVSQGYHVPPPGMPSLPFRDWEPASRDRLMASDSTVVASINAVLERFGKNVIASLGDLYLGRTLFQTYPELEMYPERGPSEYFGVVPTEGRPMLDWPIGQPRVLAYLYPYYEHLDALLGAIHECAGSSVVVCLEILPALRQAHESTSLAFADRLLDFQRMASQADLVVCHASHQATAEALLVAKPLLLVPTQVEQFLTTRRVVRQGAALGILPGTEHPDFLTALHKLLGEPAFAARARDFAKRYGSHQREQALDALADRCEAVASKCSNSRR